MHPQPNVSILFLTLNTEDADFRQGFIIYFTFRYVNITINQWSWLRDPSADFLDPDLGSRMKSFRLGFGAIDSSNFGLRTPPQGQILSELGSDGLIGPDGAYQWLRAPRGPPCMWRDLCVFGGTSAGFPLMYRPPVTSVYLAGPLRASRRCIVLPSCVLRSADVLCGRR